MREHVFKSFVKFLISLFKWFFIFDYYNYARWLSVHIQDLVTLHITCPQPNQGFKRGNFVVQISGKQFKVAEYLRQLETKMLEGTNQIDTQSP